MFVIDKLHADVMCELMDLS